MNLLELPNDIITDIYNHVRKLKNFEILDRWFWEWKQSVVYTYKGKYYILFYAL